MRLRVRVHPIRVNPDPKPALGGIQRYIYLYLHLFIVYIATWPRTRLETVLPRRQLCDCDVCALGLTCTVRYVSIYRYT